MKLALIAMSGLRTFNPELARLGMTLPGFVERGKAVAAAQPRPADPRRDDARSL